MVPLLLAAHPMVGHDYRVCVMADSNSMDDHVSGRQWRTALQHSPDELEGRSIDTVVFFGNVPLSAHNAFEETFLVDSAGVEGCCPEEHFVH